MDSSSRTRGLRPSSATASTRRSLPVEARKAATSCAPSRARAAGEGGPLPIPSTVPTVRSNCSRNARLVIRTTPPTGVCPSTRRPSEVASRTASSRASFCRSSACISRSVVSSTTSPSTAGQPSCATADSSRRTWATACRRASSHVTRTVLQPPLLSLDRGQRLLHEEDVARGDPVAQRPARELALGHAAQAVEGGIRVQHDPVPRDEHALGSPSTRAR